MKNKNQNQDVKNEYNFGELKFESPVNFEHKSLEEIKQLADDTFRESKIKRRLLRAGIGILTVGAATMAPLAVYQFIIPVKVSMKSTNENIKGYEVKLQRGSRVSEIKIVEIEGYDFIGFFKDKNCTIKYTGTEELNKNSVIYTSYKLKEYTVTIPTSDKYLLTTSGIVCHGEDFTFSVYPQEGYDLTNMVVKVGEKTLTPLEGVYTISNVTSDLEVSITGIEKIKYAITLTESDNCSVNIPSYIEHDEDLMFSITPDTGYNAAHVVVKVNGVEVTPNSSGIYVVKNVKKLLNISVTGIEKNIYNVTTSGDKEHYTVNTVSSVEYGDVLRFTITPNAGYSLDDILVKVNGEVVIPVNGVYTVENVSEDINIKVISEFSVSVIGDQNYTVNVVDSINYCENLIFNITPKTGYTLDDIIVKANGEVLTSIGGYYTIENITEDVIIEVFGKYTVNTTGDVNYTVDVVNTIYYGEDLTFTITPKAGYTLNNILVKVNGQEVTGNQGSYTIENISEDITIEVLGAYQINVNGDENCNVDIVNIIHYGENLSFTITPKEGYKLDRLAVKVNNQPITSASGIYTVENVTENITIDISGVEIIVCSVYVAGNEHCIVDVVDSINYGENLTFKIYAKNDCSIENIEVNVNGILITPVGGIYTVENVKTDVSILITGGAYVHTVSVQGNENCTVHVVQKILSGQDLNFHVTPKTGYTLEEMKVTVNNLVVEADEDDYYTFKNVSEDVTIVITGVKLITYTVSVDCDENYTVNVVDKVNYGQNLTFTITPNEGYSLDSLNVTVNGDKITAVDGVYTVTNVTRNVNIVISGAGLINYSVSVTGNENCDVDVVDFIEFGRDLTFTITPNEGYTLENVQVTVNGDVITAVSEENGVYTYTVTNVTEDITIVVTGVEK